MPHPSSFPCDGNVFDRGLRALRELLDGTGFVNVADRQRGGGRILPQHRDRHRGAERVAAEVVEEIAIDSDGFVHSERLADRGRDLRFERIARREQLSTRFHVSF